MSTKQVGEFTVTAVSDGVLYSNHDVILGVDKDESGRLLGIPYGEKVPIDVNSFLIRHNGKLILSDAGSGHTMQPTLGKLPQNLRALRNCCAATVLNRTPPRISSFASCSVSLPKMLDCCRIKFSRGSSNHRSRNRNRFNNALPSCSPR